jgi:hypothetical protein
MEPAAGRPEAGQFLDVLNVGECEPLKAAVHGVLLATAVVCAAYNAAAWLRRRQRHLALNTFIYGCAALWEHRHVQDHLACRPERRRAAPPRLRNVA